MARGNGGLLAIAAIGAGAVGYAVMRSRSSAPSSRAAGGAGGAGAGGGGAPPSPAPTRPSSPTRPSTEEDWGDPGAGGGGDAGGAGGGGDAGGAADAGSASEPSARDERALEALDPRERAEAIAAARVAAKQADQLAITKAQAENRKSLALRVIADLQTHGKAYDRALLTGFQRAAGITADGVYGPESKGALQRYSGMRAPDAQSSAAPSAPLEPTESAPTPSSTPARQAAGVTVPFVSMPAERPSTAPVTPATATHGNVTPGSARALAPSVIADLRARGKSYDRALLAAFQRAAGIAPDGLYGPATKRALDSYAPGAPAPLARAAAPSSSSTRGTSSTPSKPSASAPSASKPSAPSTTTSIVIAPKPPASAPKPALPASSTTSSSKVDLAAARRMAPTVAGNLRNRGKSGYDRAALAAFQAAAGITADGIYGPLARAALKHFGAAPPAAFASGSVTAYTPPS